MTDLAQSTSAKVIAYLSVNSHYEPFSKGLIDTKDIVFLSLVYLSWFVSDHAISGVAAVEGLS